MIDIIDDLGIIIDFETGGSKAKVHPPLDFAAQLFLIKPGFPKFGEPFRTGLMNVPDINLVDQSALNVNKFSKEEIVSIGRDPKESCLDFIDWLNKNCPKGKKLPQLFAYNALFDFSFLDTWLSDVNLDWRDYFHYSVRDIPSMATKLQINNLVPNTRLVTVATYFDISYKEHDCLEDINAALEVMRKLV